MAEGYVVWIQLEEKGSFQTEGDSGGFLNKIENGLRAWQDESWGGRSEKRCSSDSVQVMTLGSDPVNLDAKVSMTRIMTPDPSLPNFFPEAMNQLAARFHWTTTSDYKAVKHYLMVNGPHHLFAVLGQTVKLEAEVGDPDGDVLELRLWQFMVGNYTGNCSVEDSTSPKTTITVSSDAERGQTIYLILEANDNGTPNLKRYLRTIITVNE